jgi:L-rhamnono-1,4-lactonase
MRRLAAIPNVYMKLSGVFSEIGDQPTDKPWPVSDIVDRTLPWTDHVLDCFKPTRLMFGSDWPVCNVRGPGDELSWRHWRQVVANLMRLKQLDQKDKDLVWFGTAQEAYRLDLVGGDNEI